MSKNTKIVIGIIVGILLICCIGAGIAATILPRMAGNFAEEMFIEDPEQAAEIASSMLDYTLPAGFEEEFGMSFFGIKTVFISSTTDFTTMIMLMQFPETMAQDEEQMRQQFEQAFANQRNTQNYEVEFVSSETKTINGEPATLSFYDGVDQNGNDIRQAIGVFETKDGGIGMMMVVAESDNWEESGMERFLDSLR